MAIAKKDEFGTATPAPKKTAPAKTPTASKPAAKPAAPKAPTNTPATTSPADFRKAEEKSMQTFVAQLAQQLIDSNIAAGLNADGSVKPPPMTIAQKNAATMAAGPPGTAPDGFQYSFIESETGGYFALFKAGKGPKDIDPDEPDVVPSTSLDVLKAMIRSKGITAGIIDSSANYLQSLLKDGLDYDNAVQVFLNTKEYTLKNGTKLDSPFYKEYSYLNEGLTSPKSASELFNAVEGYKELRTKYGFSEKYLSTDSLKGYVKNNVTVADLDERANSARLAGIVADPSKTDALIKLGFIKTAADLQDFYMDSKIGKEQLETNRNTGAFVAEAIRRNRTGIVSDAAQTENYKKIAAELTAKGYSEAQISQLASTGFEKIGQELNPLVASAGIYDKAGGTVESNAALTSSIQAELQQEEFSNMASSRRKRLEEQNAKAFQGTSGTSASSLRTTGLI